MGPADAVSPRLGPRAWPERRRYALLMTITDKTKKKPRSPMPEIDASPALPTRERAPNSERRGRGETRPARCPPARGRAAARHRAAPLAEPARRPAPSRRPGVEPADQCMRHGEADGGSILEWDILWPRWVASIGVTKCKILLTTADRQCLQLCRGGHW